MAEERILIVEDDAKIAELLRDYLDQAGYKVTILYNGNKVIANIKSNPLDLIILDIILPGKDGMTICKEIRSFSNVPILMLTAKVDEIYRVLGLELGADDFICKPFSPREVVARVRAILRRIKPEIIKEVLVAGPITIDPECHIATIDGKNLRVTPIEFELLRLMVSHPDTVLTRSDLISSVQSDDFEGSGRIIDSHMKNLRKKIDEILPGNTLIHTVYGIGYSLNISRYDNKYLSENLQSQVGA